MDVILGSLRSGVGARGMGLVGGREVERREVWVGRSAVCRFARRDGGRRAVGGGRGAPCGVVRRSGKAEPKLKLQYGCLRNKDRLLGTPSRRLGRPDLHDTFRYM